MYSCIPNMYLLGARSAQVRLLIYIVRALVVFLTIPVDLQTRSSLDVRLCHDPRRKQAPPVYGVWILARCGNVVNFRFLLWCVLSFTSDRIMLIYGSGVFVVLFSASIVMLMFVAILNEAYRKMTLIFAGGEDSPTVPQLPCSRLQASAFS